MIFVPAGPPEAEDDIPLPPAAGELIAAEELVELLGASAVLEGAAELLGAAELEPVAALEGAAALLEVAGPAADEAADALEGWLVLLPAELDEDPVPVDVLVLHPEMATSAAAPTAPRTVSFLLCITNSFEVRLVDLWLIWRGAVQWETAQRINGERSLASWRPPLPDGRTVVPCHRPTFGRIFFWSRRPGPRRDPGAG